jgi:hypothetical protein
LEPHLPQYELRIPAEDVWFGTPPEALPAETPDLVIDLFDLRDNLIQKDLAL